MTRGNQREKAREKNLKEQAGQTQQKKKNTMSKAQMDAAKEETNRLMREKQAKAEAKKAAEAAAGGPVQKK